MLIGDTHQLQAVGRGGMFAELVATGRVVELDTIHRFRNPWEADASLGLRHGDPAVLNAYVEYDRIRAAPLVEHLDDIASAWITAHSVGERLAITTTTNEHVAAINHDDSRVPATLPANSVRTASLREGGSFHVGDVIVTRRNERHLHTSTGDTVRNRDYWTVNAITPDGGLAVTRIDGHGTVTLPNGYVAEHVQLGYAATEPGNQSETMDRSITLASGATTCQGLYVGATRGRDENMIHVVTETHDLGEAVDVLERILTIDRTDLPAIATRRELAATVPPTPVLVPRCQIPDWFNDLHVTARRRTSSMPARRSPSTSPPVSACRSRSHGSTSNSNSSHRNARPTIRRSRKRNRRSTKPAINVRSPPPNSSKRDASTATPHATTSNAPTKGSSNNKPPLTKPSNGPDRSSINETNSPPDATAYESTTLPTNETCTRPTPGSKQPPTPFTRSPPGTTGPPAITSPTRRSSTPPSHSIIEAVITPASPHQPSTGANNATSSPSNHHNHNPRFNADHAASKSASEHALRPGICAGPTPVEGDGLCWNCGGRRQRPPAGEVVRSRAVMPSACVSICGRSAITRSHSEFARDFLRGRRQNAVMDQVRLARGADAVVVRVTGRLIDSLGEH